LAAEEKLANLVLLELDPPTPCFRNRGDALANLNVLAVSGLPQHTRPHYLEGGPKTASSSGGLNQSKRRTRCRIDDSKRLNWMNSFGRAGHPRTSSRIAIDLPTAFRRFGALQANDPPQWTTGIVTEHQAVRCTTILRRLKDMFARFREVPGFQAGRFARNKSNSLRIRPEIARSWPRAAEEAITFQISSLTREIRY